MGYNFSKRTSHFTLPKQWASMRVAKKLEKETGKKIIHFEKGDYQGPDFETPEHILKATVDALNAGGTLDASGNVVPVKSNKNDTASTLSNFEDKPEVITLPMGNATNPQSGGGASGGAKEENTLPNISFDTSNPHTLYATATTGAGN